LIGPFVLAVASLGQSYSTREHCAGRVPEIAVHVTYRPTFEE